MSVAWVHQTGDERAAAEREAARRLAMKNGVGACPPEPIQAPSPKVELTAEQLAVKHAADRILARLYTAEDLDNLPDPEWLIDGLLVRNSLAVLYGKSGGGKSFTALDWALSVATGSWWFRHEVHRGPVLYVVAEGVQGMKARKNAWMAGRNVGITGDIRFDAVATNLLSVYDAAALATAAVELQPALVIIDTLARSMSGGDENSTKDMSRLIESADAIKTATGATVLIVHHTNRAEGAIRGSSALEGACDTVIECKGAEGRIRLTVDKQKDAADGGQLNLFLTPIGDSCYLTDRPGPGQSYGLDGKRNEVLEALRRVDDGDGVSTTVWLESASDLSVSKSTFYEHRKDLVVRGLVRKTGEGRSGRFSAVTSPNTDVEGF